MIADAIQHIYIYIHIRRGFGGRGETIAKTQLSRGRTGRGRLTIEDRRLGGEDVLGSIVLAIVDQRGEEAIVATYIYTSHEEETRDDATIVRIIGDEYCRVLSRERAAEGTAVRSPKSDFADSERGENRAQNSSPERLSLERYRDVIFKERRERASEREE